MEQLKLELKDSIEIEITNLWYNIELVDAYPKYLFIFGDNTRRTGKGGQAQIRSAQNTTGLATKYNPGMEDSDFFNDDDLERIKSIIDQDIEKIKNVYHVRKYDKILFPKAGLGTGLSELPKRAPMCFKYLSEKLLKEFNIQTNKDGTLWMN